MKWKIWSVISNSHFSRTTNLQTCVAYHFKHSQYFTLFPLGKYISEFFLKTGQISEYPNLNEILDPDIVNALYEGGYKQKKGSVRGL